MADRAATDFLGDMARASRRRAGALDPLRVARRAARAADPPSLVLDAAGFDLIAEVKRRSPSEGPLATPRDADDRLVERLARSYAEAGACAISVLTEPERFDGSLEDLGRAAAAVRLPVIRKDFLVDPVQVLEARAAGAAGVLLIARLIEPRVLDSLADTASDCGLFVLVEAFDGHDLPRAVAAARRARERGGRALLGVNGRDLTTLAVGASRHETLASALPEDLPAVAESGIVTPDDAARVAACGYRAALVGTALVRDADPGAAARGLIEGGRAGALRARESRRCASS